MASEPPALPGAAPPPLMPPQSEPTSPPGFEGRLHPLTLGLILFNAARNFLVPAVLVLATGSEGSLGRVLLVFLGINLVTGLIRYFTFTYRVEGGELITRQGIVERRERHIPLDRVQDLRLEQGLVHRFLGVVDVEVETAGGSGSEASLSVLSKPQADALRQAIFAGRSARAAVQAEAAPTVDEVIHALSLRDLVLEGLTSNRAASALLVLAAGWQFLDELVPARLWERWVETFSAEAGRWLSNGDHANWLGITVLVLVVVALSTVFSVVGSVLLFHGFTLRRRGDDLQRAYGLLTRRASSLPRRRIQLLKIEEPWLRRWLGLATLRADSAGSRGEADAQQRSGRDVLCPVVPRQALDAVLRSCLPDYEPASGPYQPVARCAIRRGTVKALGLCLLLAGVSFGVQRTLWSVWPLLLIPVAYAVNVRTFQHLGYLADGPLFRLRRGWLSRSTHLIPVRNVQVIVLHQSPFDRRHKVRTLLVDTAGQAATGGGPRLRNVPAAQAEAVARDVARRASRVRYRW